LILHGIEPALSARKYLENIFVALGIRVPRKDIHKLHKNTSENYLGFGDNSDDVQGLLQVFHALHCLNELRKSTYLDYYPNITTFANEHPETHRLHTGTLEP
jgi:hypothetical protein